MSSLPLSSGALEGGIVVRIDRGPEPAALTRARARRLAAAHDAYVKHGAPSPELTGELTGYTCAKKALFLAQKKKKCAYCELRTALSSAPTEHFRPKDGAFRHDRDASCDRHVKDLGHYWWRFGAGCRSPNDENMVSHGCPGQALSERRGGQGRTPGNQSAASSNAPS